MVYTTIKYCTPLYTMVYTTITYCTPLYTTAKSVVHRMYSKTICWPSAEQAEVRAVDVSIILQCGSAHEKHYDAWDNSALSRKHSLAHFETRIPLPFKRVLNIYLLNVYFGAPRDIYRIAWSQKGFKFSPIAKTVQRIRGMH